MMRAGGRASSNQLMALPLGFAAGCYHEQELKIVTSQMKGLNATGRQAIKLNGPRSLSSGAGKTCN